MEELYRTNNFPRESIFYNLLKKNGIHKTHKEVKDFISKQGIYQVHKQITHKRTKEQHFTAHEPNHIWQCDLIDYDKFASQNEGNHWILIIIDVFKRKAFTAPCTRKEASIVKEAFETIVKSNGIPKILFHDSGTEFLGTFRTFCESNNIVDLQNEAGNHNALGIIDRFTRTLKTMIAKHMTANATTNWTNSLQRLTEIYNETPHRGIDNLEPDEVDANETNLAKVGTLNFEKENKNAKHTHTKVKFGDIVRVMHTKGTFAKGYDVTFSIETFRVTHVANGKATLDDGNTVSNKKLMVVPEGTTQVQTNREKAIAESTSIAKRKAAFLGVKEVDKQNILPTKRIRNLKDPHIRE